MKIAKTSKIRSKIRNLYERVDATEMVEEMLTDPIDLKGIYFDDYFQMNEEARKLQWEMQQDGHEISFDKALIATMLFSVVEEDDDFAGVILDHVIDNSKVFHKGELAEDPYLKNIKVAGAKAGDYSLDMKYYAKYELFTYGEEFEVIDGVYAPKVAVCDHKHRYPAVTKEDNTVFGLTPRYMASVEDAVEKASGKVLVLGSGMGYFTYLASLKEDVESVTVVEKDEDLAELLKSYILPQFEKREKVTVLTTDPFEYMESLPDGDYDYCFSDVSATKYDFIPYMNLRNITSKFSSMQVDYRNEASIQNFISFLTLSLLMFEQREREITEADAFYAEFQYLQKLLEDKEINSVEDIDWILEPENLIGLVDESAS